MPFQRSERLAAIAYALATPLAIVAAFGFEAVAIRMNGYLSIRVVDGRPMPTLEWTLLAVNTLPSILAGGLVFGAAALSLQRRIQGVASARWLYRCAGPVLGVVILAGLIGFASTAGAEFWLFGQALIWPLIALVAGLGVEHLLTARFRARAERSK